MAPAKLQPPSGLNIILGDSAGSTFIQNFGSQDLLIDRDVLSVGPTMRCADFAAWKDMRSSFWGEVLEGRESFYPTNPIEDWAAGTQLSSRSGNLWFNDGGKLLHETGKP